MEMPNETKSDKESDYDCVIKGNTYSSVYYFLFDAELVLFRHFKSSIADCLTGHDALYRFLWKLHFSQQDNTVFDTWFK